MAFIEFMTSVKGQKLIYQFGRDKYGKSLFIPDAVPISKLVASYPAKGKTTIDLKVRSGRGPQYSVVGVIKKGTEIKLLGAKAGWYTIIYKNKTAYVFGQYIKKL
jgi:tungstate transport system substrate-binding protein